MKKAKIISLNIKNGMIHWTYNGHIWEGKVDKWKRINSQDDNQEAGNSSPLVSLPKS